MLFTTLRTTLAQLISVIAHPLLVVTYLSGLFFYTTPEHIGITTLSASTIQSILALLFVCTFLVPSVCIFLLYKMGHIRSIQLNERRERTLPYLLAGLIYGGTALLFGALLQNFTPLNTLLATLLSSTSLAILLVALINQSWKISAHTTGIGGALGAILGLYWFSGADTLYFPLLLTLLLCGLVSSARLYLNAHTPAQVNAGLLLGGVVSFCALWIYF